MNNKEFLYKYDNCVRFTSSEIISMCKGKVGTNIKILRNKPEDNMVTCEFTVAKRRFQIDYMGAHDSYGQAWDDDFCDSYPKEIRK